MTMDKPDSIEEVEIADSTKKSMSKIISHNDVNVFGRN